MSLRSLGEREYFRKNLEIVASTVRMSVNNLITLVQDLYVIEWALHAAVLLLLKADAKQLQSWYVLFHA